MVAMCQTIGVQKTMTAITMPRKRVTYRIDTRLIDAAKKRARMDNNSANNWLENLLISTLKKDGVLDEDFEPLGETRGGDRTQPESEEN